MNKDFFLNKIWFLFENEKVDRCVSICYYNLEHPYFWILVEKIKYWFTNNNYEYTGSWFFIHNLAWDTRMIRMIMDERKTEKTNRIFGLADCSSWKDAGKSKTKIRYKFKDNCDIFFQNFIELIRRIRRESTL